MLAQGKPWGLIAGLLAAGVGVFMIENLSTGFGVTLGYGFVVGGLIGGVA